MDIKENKIHKIKEFTMLRNTSSNKLSKPQPNVNTTVGFDMKMTLQTPPHPPPTETFQALLDELES